MNNICSITKKGVIIVLMLVLIGSLISAKVYNIKINQNGESIGTVELPPKFNKGDAVTISIESNGSFVFVSEITEIAVKTKSIPVYRGQQDPFALNQVKKTEVIPVNLKESGIVYTIKITRYPELRFPNREGNVLIYTKSFRTHSRYYFGLHMGIVFPFNKENEFELGFKSPADTTHSIIKHDIYKPKLLLYGSIYPFGFEPGKPLGIESLRRIHFDFGTEISDKIFERIYLGVGYDFKYFSLDLFVIMGKYSKLDPDFTVETMIPATIKSVPLKHEFDTSLGFAICFPFDFAANWIGKAMGIK